MPYTTDQLMQMAADGGSKMHKPKNVEAIVILFDPATMATGWASTVPKPDMLSVMSDVLDMIICQDGGK